MAVYETKAPTGSTQKRFQEAVRIIRANGIKWAFNVQACCRSCASPEARWEGKKNYDPYTTPVGWTFGGQGSAIYWLDGEPAKMEYSSYYRKMVKAHLTEEVSTFVYHDNDSAALIADAFRMMGFEVKWDGSNLSAVEVVLQDA